MIPAPHLRLAVIFEPEDAAAARLREAGFPAGIADEIAVYLAQSTDLPAFMPGLAHDLAAHGVLAEFVAIDDLLDRVAGWRASPMPTVLWAMTDGFAYYRGSTVAALGRLAGLPVFGSPPQALHLCQDKFKCGMLARAAGLRVPETALYEGAASIAGDALEGSGPYFVKPNRLGAKIGIFADSRAETFADAIALAERIEQRYCDRAVIQRFVPGYDVRVSFMDTGGPLLASLGLSRMVKDNRSETGGDFLTMRDNASLSGSRDTHGTVGGFGAKQAIAFTPMLQNLRADAAAADVVSEIENMVARAVALFDLRDLWSFDFRVSEAGEPFFLEFEVCPAVTIYDFQTYLGTVQHMSLGEALAQGARRAAGRMRDA